MIVDKARDPSEKADEGVAALVIEKGRILALSVGFIDERNYYCVTGTEFEGF